MYSELNCYNIIKESKYKPVINITHTGVLRKIDILYRATYLKDTIFAKEEGLNMPNSLLKCIRDSSSDILNHIISNDHSCLNRVFHKAQHGCSTEELLSIA